MINLIRPANTAEVPVLATIAHRLNSLGDQRCKGFPSTYEGILRQFERMVIHPPSQLLVDESDGSINGILALLVEPEDNYLQAIGGVFAEENYHAVAQSFYSYIMFNYRGYRMHAAYPKENTFACDFLGTIGAELEDYDYEYRLFKNELQNFITGHGVQELTEQFYTQFSQLHNELHPDVFWTGDKLINSLDKFKIHVATKGVKIIGFVVTSNSARPENEIYFLHAYDNKMRDQLLRAAVAGAFASCTEELLMMIDKDNADDRQLLQQLGFRQTDTCLTFLINVL